MTEEVQFRPDGPVRPNTLYLSRKLFKAIGYVAKAQQCTREDVAERWLNESLQAYPAIVAHLEAVEVTEKAFLKTLKPVPSE